MPDIALQDIERDFEKSLSEIHALIQEIRGMRGGPIRLDPNFMGRIGPIAGQLNEMLHDPYVFGRAAKPWPKEQK